MLGIGKDPPVTEIGLITAAVGAVDAVGVGEDVTVAIDVVEGNLIVDVNGDVALKILVVLSDIGMLF